MVSQSSRTQTGRMNIAWSTFLQQPFLVRTKTGREAVVENVADDCDGTYYQVLHPNGDRDIRKMDSVDPISKTNVMEYAELPVTMDYQAALSQVITQYTDRNYTLRTQPVLSMRSSGSLHVADCDSENMVGFECAMDSDDDEGMEELEMQMHREQHGLYMQRAEQVGEPEQILTPAQSLRGPCVMAYSTIRRVQYDEIEGFLTISE